MCGITSAAITCPTMSCMTAVIFLLDANPVPSQSAPASMSVKAVGGGRKRRRKNVVYTGKTSKAETPTGLPAWVIRSAKRYHNSRTSVTVFITNYIVFLKIGAGLHFDNLERNFARIAQAVLRTDRDKRGFIFREQRHLITLLHQGRSFHHNPVFGAVMMKL